MCSHFNLYIISLIDLSMKKNFFAKLGHFFLVSAVLFNGFGVGFVKADGFTVDFVSPSDTVLEGNVGDATVTYQVPVKYNGLPLEGDSTYNVHISISQGGVGATSAVPGLDFNVPGSTNDNSFYDITFTSSTQSQTQYVVVEIVSDNVYEGDELM